MELRGGKLQPRGRQFSESPRSAEPGTPAAQSTQQNTAANQGGAMTKEGSMSSGMRKSRGKLLAAVLIIAVVVLAGAWLCWGKVMSDEGDIKSAQFQAVFLTNGQVYFGHIKNIDSKYVILGDIFYLQVQQQVQPASSNTSNNSNSQVSLAKLGSELHGPEDQMFIARDQVLFWENLKDSGKVVQAINTYQQQK